jgi:hypothetical protein
MDSSVTNPNSIYADGQYGSGLFPYGSAPIIYAVTPGSTFEGDLLWAHTQFTDTRRAEKYLKTRNYYDGFQQMEFATVKFEQAFGNQFATFSYNRCASVIDAMADRLQLTGFDVEGDDQALSGKEMAEEEASGPGAEEVEDPLQEAIDAIWSANRLDRKQGELHTESLKTGDAYLVVWPEAQPDGSFVPKFHVNKAGTMAVALDEDTRERQLAVKAWKVTTGPLGGKWRVTFYYPDRIEKWVTRAKHDGMSKIAADYEPYNPSLEGRITTEAWPLPNPFKEIPVFWFPNNSSFGEWGRSELRDVIPIQDALNKACMDLLVAMEYGAFRQRWVTGMGFGQPDINGKVQSPFKSGPGEVWSGPPNANFGDFAATDLSQFLAVEESYDAKISNVARIPQHWLSLSMANPPSGEALKTAEAPFVAKIKDRQISFGNTWEDAFRLALKMFGVNPLPNLTARWTSAELRSDLDRAQVSQLKAAVGVPNEQLWAELDYTASQIEEFAEMKARAIDQAQSAMNAGGLSPFPIGADTGPLANETPAGTADSGPSGPIAGGPTNGQPKPGQPKA